MDFFCIGAQKSGTTSLHDILSQHPEIALPRNKETHFFSHDQLYTEDLADYFKMFNRDYKTKEIIGEVDPEYLCTLKAPERILKHFGIDVKFIVILRNPVDRAYSQYLMSKRRGFEELGFSEALALENERTKDDFGNLYFSYGSRSLYCHQIKRYLELFNSSNFLFLRFEEDFLENKTNTIERVNTFLGLSKFDYSLDIESNKASVARNKWLRDFVNKPNLIRKVGKQLIRSSQLRKNIIGKIDLLNRKNISYSVDDTLKNQLIQTFFLNDIKELESLTNLNLSRWYKKK